jgi:hypothetical protein
MTEWWLASDEGAVVAHLGVGKKSADRRKLRPGNPFIARGERERGDGCGPVRQWRLADGSPVWWGCGVCRVPLSQVSDGWPSVGVSKPGVSPNGCGLHCSSVRPTNNWFSILLNWTEFVNYESHLSLALKFTKLFNLIEWEIRNNFPFGNKSKFETIFELTFLEEKLVLNLGQFYWGSNLFGKLW